MWACVQPCTYGILLDQINIGNLIDKPYISDYLVLEDVSIP